MEKGFKEGLCIAELEDGFNGWVENRMGKNRGRNDQEEKGE